MITGRKLVALLKSGRTWLYGVLVPTVVGLIVSVTSGGMGVKIFLIWLLLCALIVTAFEGFLRVRSTETSAAWYAGTNAALKRSIPQSVEEYITQAGETGVDILGGTLGEFAQFRANVDALDDLDRRGYKLRILMMDPNGSGVEQLSDQRRQVGKTITAVELKAEIRKNLKHLFDQLGKDGMRRCCRLYQHTPRNSVYRLGDFYIVTVYRFGAAGSSPTLAITRTDQNTAFCDGLDRGFDDIWQAESTRAFSDDDIA